MKIFTVTLNGKDYEVQQGDDGVFSLPDSLEYVVGVGTALKPAIEPILLCRKPLDGTVANNVLAHGVGGLNIDACRVPTEDKLGGGGATTPVSDGRDSPYRHRHEDIIRLKAETEKKVAKAESMGRFPANVLLDEHAAKEMDKQSGVSVSNVRRNVERDYTNAQSLTPDSGKGGDRGHTDSGGASRFFPVFKYQAKAPKRERPVIEREDGSKIQHNTVKPLALMEWLVSLIVPPGGVVLDPFAGSGTTLQAALNKGFTPIGIEQDADYIKLIEKRLEATCTTHKN